MGVRVKNFFHDAVYFVTITACEWQKVFEYPECRELVYKWFDYQKTHYQNKIHGYVIMPNHIHFIVYISKESPPLSKIIQNGKRFMAYGIVKYLKSHEAESSTRDSAKGFEKKKHILYVFESQARKEKGALHKIFEERYDAKLFPRRSLLSCSPRRSFRQRDFVSSKILLLHHSCFLLDFLYILYTIYLNT